MKALEMLRTQYKVSDFVSWQRAKTLVLSPSFQRRPVWQPGAKSYLIDTIVRGLPIPIIFLREQRADLTSFESRREVVDGQQRIRTVLSYVDSSLLDDYKPARDEFAVQSVHNKELAGQCFSELSPDIQQRILDYQFSVHVLPPEIDDREVLQIFARMNATGVKLNAQELRNAEYFGEFKTSMYQLASEQLPRWRKWRIFTEYNIARMDEVELTSEFALLMLRGLTGKTQAAIGRIYKQKDSEYPERAEAERRFRIIMDSIDDRLGDEIRFLPFRKKTLFYSLFAYFYDSQFKIDSPLERIRQKPISPATVARVKLAGERIQQKTAPDGVLEAVARRTTHVSSRQAVLNYLRASSR
jgi:uncharacterized protein with ParB-like and HNH nuclease domain